MSEDLPTTTSSEKKKDEEEGQSGQEEKVKWFLINKGFVSVADEWVALDHITAVFLVGYGSVHDNPIHYTAVRDGRKACVCIVTSNKWTYRCRHVLQTQDQAKDALFQIMDHVAE